MKITVVGTIARDTIFPFEGEKIESYGGILYNIIPLAHLVDADTVVCPICNLGEDIYDVILEKLRIYPNLDLRGIRRVPQPNNHVTLVYLSPDQRVEVLTHQVPSLSFSQIKPFLDSHLILVNFISGFDLSLTTLREIRRNTEAIIFMDVHSLTLGIDATGRRFPRPVGDWRGWVAQADIVQVNRLEAEMLMGRRLPDRRDLVIMGEEVLGVGVKVVLITLGSEGALVVFRAENGANWELAPAEAVEVVDPTGCGDVFSAGFVVEYLRSGDPVRATRFANRVAGFNCRLRGLEELTLIGKVTEFSRSR